MEPLKYPRHWIERKQNKKKISVITAYDGTMARLLDRTEVDAILVGDSLSMTVQANSTTLPVTLDEMIYHCKIVKRSSSRFVIGDLPFGSVHVSRELAVASAVRLMKESGVDAVKLEGASALTLEIVRHLTSIGVPVMGHLGFLPQSIHTLGGYRIQGKGGSDQLMLHARALQDAGCFAIVLELIAEESAGHITRVTSIPTIGIGSGTHTDGQVQVLHDVLGLDPDFLPRHAMKQKDLWRDITEAVNSFDAAVKKGV